MTEVRIPASRGSVAEKVWVSINGVAQGMFIKGSNRSDPVLLWVHGGPGMPDYFLLERYPTGLEELFTVVWWDQRGAGLFLRPRHFTGHHDGGAVHLGHPRGDRPPA